MPKSMPGLLWREEGITNLYDYNELTEFFLLLSVKEGYLWNYEDEMDLFFGK
jgi:hypothetical protein